MMQFILSIQAGKILPATLLRKLGSHSWKNKLNRTFRELGRLERTLFLLRYRYGGTTGPSAWLIIRFWTGTRPIPDWRVLSPRNPMYRSQTCT
jgi:hypothetical protein